MEELLRKLQLTELEILKTVHAFCVKHDIRYSLYAGTLLGAVRHKGFIPWDDDIDICMSRKEYDRFIRLWQENPVKGYSLQNKDNSPAFISSFTKIRKDHTTFLENELGIGNFHTGVFIDIFPLDRIPSAWLPKRVFYVRCMLYQLMIRGYAPKECGAVTQFGCKVLLSAVPAGKRSAAIRRLLRGLTKYQDRSDLRITGIETMRSVKVEYPAAMFDAYVSLPFEDDTFSAFAQWDENLRAKFGDYMQLPPEEERAWTHHPIRIDFEHDIEEILAANDEINTHPLSGL